MDFEVTAEAGEEMVIEEFAVAGAETVAEESAESSEEVTFEETVEAAAEETTTVIEGADKASEEVIQPSSPTAASGEAGPIPEPSLALVENAALDQSNQVSDPTAPLATPPEGLQLILWAPPLRLGRAGHSGEVPPAIPTKAVTAPLVEIETAHGTPPPSPEIEAAAEVEPVTPVPTRKPGEESSSFSTRAARLWARTTPPTDPEPIRLARSFLHGLFHHGSRPNVFDLVGRIREAHEALDRHLAGGNPVLDQALELADAVESQARRVLDIGAQSASREQARRNLDNQMANLLAELGEAGIPGASSENPSAGHARRVEALEAQIAEQQAQLARARQDLARALEVEARLQAAEEAQEALDSAVAAAEEVQAQAYEEEIALEGMLLELYRVCRRA